MNTVRRFLTAGIASGLTIAALCGAAAPALAAPPEHGADFAGAAAGADAKRLAQWIVASHDNGALPFAILDKKDARLFVFGTGGKLVGNAPVLLGAAPGDDTVPGIGDRPLAEVKPEERTTAAGRFVTEPGRNLRNEDVIWVDYDAAVSMHRVITSNAAEHRAERLATPTPTDNRISYGCINVPVPFFERVLWPALRGGRSVVYVLPEKKSLEDVFPGLAHASVRG